MTLSRRDLDRIGRMLRAYEGDLRRGGGPAGERGAAFISPDVQFVRVTSVEPEEGRYPGVVLDHNAEADTYSDLGEVWVVGPNGEELEEKRYLARRSGPAADGKSVFVVVIADGDADGCWPEHTDTFDTTSHHDYDLPVGKRILSVSVTVSDAELSGIVRGSRCQPIWIHNLGPEPLALRHDDAGSTAGNRLLLPGDRSLILTAGTGVGLYPSSEHEAWLCLDDSGQAQVGTPDNPLFTAIGPHVNMQFRGHVMFGETLTVFTADQHDFPLAPETTYLNVRVVNPDTPPSPPEAAFGVRLTGAGGITGAIHPAVLSTVSGETGVSSGGILYTNPGRLLFVVNRSPDNVLTIAHESTESLAGNRFYLPGLKDLVLQPGEGMGFYYSGHPESIYDQSTLSTAPSFGDLLNDPGAGGPHYGPTLSADFGSAGRWMPLDKGHWLEQRDTWDTSKHDYPLEPGISLLTVDVTAGAFLTGLAGGHAGRVVWVVNRGTNNRNHILILKHNDSDSVAANRLRLPRGADILLRPHESIGLYYSPAEERWISLNYDVPWRVHQEDVEEDTNNFVVVNRLPFLALTPINDDWTITGFTAGYEGRPLWITNRSTEHSLTLAHDSTDSDEENRMMLPGAADYVLGPLDGVGLYYDDSESRWFCLDQKGGGSGFEWSDELVRVSETDCDPGFLFDKLEAGENITLEINFPEEEGESEEPECQEQTVLISALDEKVMVSGTDCDSGYLFDKIEAGAGIGISVETEGEGEETCEKLVITAFSSPEFEPGCGVEIVTEGEGEQAQPVLKVKAEDLAGDGLIAGSGEDDCQLHVNPGCGITIQDDQVSVAASDLAGPGLIPDESGETGDCSLMVNAGCGIEIVEDEVRVNPTDIAGAGLVPVNWPASCQIAVDPGCGLQINGNLVEVNPADLAGDGLVAGVGEGCQIHVNPGCGITIQDNQVKVAPSDLAGPGLVVDDSGETGECSLMVNPGCGIEVVDDEVRVNPTDIAGAGLVPVNWPDECTIAVDPGCGLRINGNLVEVDAAELAGDGLYVVDEGEDDCRLHVLVGCGLFINNEDEGQLQVDNTQLAGNGLEAGSDCKLNVRAGCNLTFDGGELIVDVTSLAGDGLVVDDSGACPKLAVDIAAATLPDIGCGLRLDQGEGESDLGTLSVEPQDLAGDGLVAGSGEGEEACRLHVNPGCGISIQDGQVQVAASDLAGAGLAVHEDPEAENPGCALAIDQEIDSTFTFTETSGINLSISPDCIIKLEWTTKTITLHRNTAGVVVDVTESDPQPHSQEIDPCCCTDGEGEGEGEGETSDCPGGLCSLAIELPLDEVVPFSLDGECPEIWFRTAPDTVSVEVCWTSGVAIEWQQFTGSSTCANLLNSHIDEQNSGSPCSGGFAAAGNQLFKIRRLGTSETTATGTIECIPGEPE